MVGLLWLAHDRACEAELAQQLDELLAADRLPDLKLLEQRFVAHLNDVPVVTVDIPGADSYDALFAARELATTGGRSRSAIRAWMNIVSANSTCSRARNEKPADM